MTSLNELKGQKLHQRTITIESFRVNDDRIIIEGSLNDSRTREIYTLMGENRPPGPVHGMVARLLVGDTPPRILEAEAEMPKIPSQECEEAMATIKKLIGLPIVYGFSKAVKDRLGGATGCTHLTSLVLSMGSAAMQGFANNRGQNQLSNEARSMMVQYVKNSCYVWREDGELFKKVVKEIKKA